MIGRPTRYKIRCKMYVSDDAAGMGRARTIIYVHDTPPNLLPVSNCDGMQLFSIRLGNK